MVVSISDVMSKNGFQNINQMTKAELRQIHLAHQTTLTVVNRENKGLSITSLLFGEIAFSFSKVHCFLPIERFNEIDTHLILERLWTEFPQIETVVPRVNPETNLIENLRYDRKTELQLNSWGIHEPAHDRIVETEKIDLFLVPLLCFDERGYRVGYGKGFYDRLLAGARPGALKVGLSYFPPVAEISDVNEFDIRLDACITPDKIWRF